MSFDAIGKHLLGHRYLYYIITFFVAFIALGDVGFAFSESVKDSINFGITMINFFLTVILSLGSLVTFLVSLFLTPEWVNGTIFGLDEPMKDIWIMVSNVVYFIFAGLLIFIAFMNIIGRGTDKYELKQALPKFIVGILIVPFSWFIVQFILSLSAILTVSVIGIPNDVLSNGDQTETLEKIKLPQTCTITIGSVGEALKGSKSSEAAEKKTKELFHCSEEKISGKESLQKSSTLGILNIYSYGLMRLDKLETLSTGETEWVKGIGDLFVKLLFDIIFIVIYFILLITLLIVLLVRGIMLWLYMMLSPAFGLMYFFGADSSASEKFSVKEFIALALVPVYVAAALAFGLLFLLVVDKGMNDINQTENQGETLLDKVGFDSKGKDPSLTYGGMKLIFKGGADNSVFQVGEEVFGQGLDFIGKIIMQLFGLVILWVAVMAALKQSKTTEMISQPVADFGKSVGELAAKSPQYLPVFGGKSAAEVGAAGGALKSSVHSHYSSKGSEFGQQLSPFGTTEASNMKAVNDSHKHDQDNLNSVSNHIANQSKNIDDLSNIFKDAGKKSHFMDMIKMKFGEKVYDLVKGSQSKQDFYTKFKESDITTEGGKNYWNTVLRNKRQDAETFASAFESVNVNNPHSTQNSSDTVSKEVKNNGDVYINIGGSNPGKVSVDENDNISSFNNHADSFAKHIVDTNMTSSQFDDLRTQLNFNQSAQDELNKYFHERDGKIVFVSVDQDGKFPDGVNKNDYTQKSLQDFLNQNG
ncbi:hypothetical protein MK079_01155 [Candidatus Gracilibacteria bacterium]|nr:hypothetical protein [Candidatus Gracilibacteria bacterium]